MRIDFPGKGPIEFEGHKLSDAAKSFELTPGYNSFPPDCRKWILDLHYAWAKGQSAESSLILQTCKLIEEASSREKTSLMTTVQKSFPKLSSEEFMQHWLHDLATIHEIASQQEVCYWIVRPEPGEVDFFLNLGIKIIKINKGFAQAPKQFKQRMDSILNAPEAEKINFILDFTNIYSDKE